MAQGQVVVYVMVDYNFFTLYFILSIHLQYVAVESVILYHF